MLSLIIIALMVLSIAYVAQPDSGRSVGSLRRLVRHHPAVGPYLRPHRPQEDVHDRGQRPRAYSASFISA